jgi:hypothetical protein
MVVEQLWRDLMSYVKALFEAEATAIIGRLKGILAEDQRSRGRATGQEMAIVEVIAASLNAE